MDKSRGFNGFIGLLLWLVKKLPRGGFPLLRIIAKNTTILQNYPLSLRLSPSRPFYADLRESIYFPLFKYGYYPHQQAEESLLLEILKKGDIVYDVGANIGYMTRVFLTAVGSSGIIIAFEPSQKAFRFLNMNYENNTTISLVNKAVGAISGKGLFVEEEYLDRSHICFAKNISDNYYEVEITTLDHYFRREISKVPTLLKIDVEGYEYEVLAGSPILLSASSPPIIMFEALAFDAMARNVDIINRLSKGTYCFARITNKSCLSNPFESESASTNNFIAIPPWAEKRFSNIPGIKDIMSRTHNSDYQ